MAITNNLRVYAEQASGSRVMDAATYTANNDRLNGAQPNTAISSSLMNTALRSLSRFYQQLVELLVGHVDDMTMTIDSDTSGDDLYDFLAEGFYNLPVASAASLIGTWTFNIFDYDLTNDGDANVTFDANNRTIGLKLPENVKFNTVTATYFDGLAYQAEDLKTWSDFRTVDLGADGFELPADVRPLEDRTLQMMLVLHNGVTDKDERICFPLVTLYGHDSTFYTSATCMWCHETVSDNIILAIDLTESTPKVGLLVKVLSSNTWEIVTLLNQSQYFSRTIRSIKLTAAMVRESE